MDTLIKVKDLISMDISEESNEVKDPSVDRIKVPANFQITSKVQTDHNDYNQNYADKNLELGHVISHNHLDINPEEY